jgi:hypothetical protein
MYQERNGAINDGHMLTADMLNVVKFFISTNLALRVLENEYLRRILRPSIELTGITTFRYTILPCVMEKLKTRIGEKCQNAASIVLIPDGWTSPLNREYLGFLLFVFA